MSCAVPPAHPLRRTDCALWGDGPTALDAAGAGRLVAVLDAAWPDRLVGCEAQSERWHGGPRGAQRDLDRHNLLTSMGWRMLYATWADVRSPEQFTARLAELYRSPAPATGR